MRKLMAIAVLLLLIGGAAYLYYVRGVGVSAQIPRPATIERAAGVRTYTWGVGTAVPTPRTEVAAAVLAGKIYVIGGFDGLGQTVATVEVYDPASGLWAAGPDLPTPRHHLGAVTAGDALYVLGGYTGSSFEPHTEVYALDARTTSWRPVAPLPAARGAMAASVLDGKLYLVGGVGPEGLANELFVYDTVADHWEERRPAPTRRTTWRPPHCKAGSTSAGGGSRACRRTWPRSRSTIRRLIPGTWERTGPLLAAGWRGRPSTGSSS